MQQEHSVLLSFHVSLVLILSQVLEDPGPTCDLPWWICLEQDGDISIALLVMKCAILLTFLCLSWTIGLGDLFQTL